MPAADDRLLARLNRVKHCVKHRGITPAPYFVPHATADAHGAALTAIIDLDSDDDADDEPDQRADEVERWIPDEQLLLVVLGSPKSPRKLTAMPDEDRCHLVAGLTVAGWSAKETKHRCGGSIRLIRSLRAEPLTRVCRWAIEEVEKVNRLLRAEKSARLAAESDLEQSRRREIRLRAQHQQLLDALTAGNKVDTCSKGHPMVPYNTYRHRGKNHCRECRRDWDNANRRSKLAV